MNITIDGVSRDGTPEGDTVLVQSGKDLVVNGLSGVDSLTVLLSGNADVYNNIYTGGREISGANASITGVFTSFEDTRLLFDGGDSVVRLTGLQGTYPVYLDGGAGHDSLYIPYTGVTTESFSVSFDSVTSAGNVFRLGGQNLGDVRFNGFEELSLAQYSSGQVHNLSLSSDVAQAFTRINGTQYLQDNLYLYGSGDAFLWDEGGKFYVGYAGAAAPTEVTNFETFHITAARLYVGSQTLFQTSYQGSTLYSSGALEFVTSAATARLQNLSTSTFSGLSTGAVWKELLDGPRNDFNGDGRSDILWRNDNGTLTNWLGQADGGFVGNYAAGVLSLPDGWNVIGTGDFNGDGRADVLWRHENGTVTDWLAQANGNFQGNWENAAYGVDTSWRAAGTGDFNGDGRSDVLWRKTDGSVTSWSGNANGSFGSSASSYQAGAGWNVAGTGDFNGDGRDDILWRNDNGTLTNWLGQADGSFVGNYAAGVLSLENAWNVVGTGDFNGDGRDDVLWRNDNGVLTNWLSQPNGNFTGNYANAAYQIDNGWQLALTGDVNGDGRDDIVWRTNDGSVIDWLGQANGSFVPSGLAPISIDNSWHAVPNDIFVS